MLCIGLCIHASDMPARRHHKLRRPIQRRHLEPWMVVSRIGRLYRWPVGCHWHYCLRRLQDANSVLPRLAIPRHHCCISAPTTAALPPWSPDGNEIVYVCTLPSKPAQVCIVSRDGGAIEQVQLPSSSFPDDPQWSPDGKSLLIALYPAGGLGKAEDFSVAQYDLQTKKITTLAGSEGMLGPRWSPDGRYVSLFSADTKREVLLEAGTGKK